MAAEYTQRANPAGGGGGPDSPERSRSLRSLLRGRHLVVLDGATGTELERRGVHTGLPLWSTHALLDAPGVVAEIHRSYAEAGAQVVTANTFRTQRRVLEPVGRGGEAGALTELAVALARDAGAPYVVGSAPPLEDCYRPDLVPEDDLLRREHAEHADNLARAGVDGIAVETMNDSREARAAAEAARATGLPFYVSFTCGPDARLLSGEPLAGAIDAVALFDPEAVLVNCLPASSVDPCLSALSACGLSFGAYPNQGEPDDATGFTRAETPPDAFAADSDRWRLAGATVLGGCCGTTPAHIEALARLASPA